ncbi:formate--tetrahydrofolate ligase [Laribacter hongkongensis]|uniref:formate--tetrahydrofolate ligase n=1 Tax=Laribacter hongkongensis TaxID=168471 RepID=UPI001EFEBA35|nr:formate--tetrahydrofolate ligase [Laribacter hongkongensis]MCG9080451.1 formate--tetrahydrofolate ligase [Laribacter hongkongensis]
MLSDLDIAQRASLLPITDLASRIGLDPAEYEPYGRAKAKVTLRADRPRGRLILVTATSGTPAGSGKTTVSIALAQAMQRLGQSAALALREPSLGPCFGLKGCATGGGYAQLLPMEDINLHFTGDFHAVTSANNLIAALIDNLRFQQPETSVAEVLWRRVLDVNDRALRQVVTGLGGGANGVPAETGFDITAASEIMAVLCLAEDEADLRRRLDALVLGFRPDGTPLTGRELGSTGAVMALLRDAVKPNLVQSLEGNAAFVHGGPFANIAHGCNSVAATRAALSVADWAITEAGFGSDLGAEKFFNIVSRQTRLAPAAVVLVTTLASLKWHGGCELADVRQPQPAALMQGLANLGRHLDNLAGFGQRVVVALNRFADDSDNEIAMLAEYCHQRGAAFAPCDGHARGGVGAEALAWAVLSAAQAPDAPVQLSYADDDSVPDKLDAIVRKVYGGSGVRLSEAARRDLARIEAMGLAHLPVCVAKTQFSFTADSKRRGAPDGFSLPVTRLIPCAGAGFIVAMAGSIMRMPGLSKSPQALRIDMQDDRISGLA